MIPPVRADHGVNIGVGRIVFVNSGCTLDDIGGIDIGAGAVVTADVPPSTLVAGVPARVGREL